MNKEKNDENDKRDEFSPEVKENLAKRAAYLCSNCRILTLGPSKEVDKIIKKGIAAHITAAGKGGPRYNALLSSEQRKAESNGIFLCASCANMIDKNNGIDFSTELLIKWKEDHLKYVSDLFVNNIKPFKDSNNDEFSINQDRIVFNKLINKLSGDEFKVIVYNIGVYRNIYSDDLEKIQEYYEMIQKIENQFNNFEVQRVNLLFQIKFGLLIEYIDAGFKIFPNNPTSNGYNYCLFPDNDTERNSDDFSEENMDFFNEQIDICLDKSQETLKAHELLRNTIKQILLV